LETTPLLGRFSGPTGGRMRLPATYGMRKRQPSSRDKGGPTCPEAGLSLSRDELISVLRRASSAPRRAYFNQESGLSLKWRVGSYALPWGPRTCLGPPWGGHSPHRHLRDASLPSLSALLVSPLGLPSWSAPPWSRAANGSNAKPMAPTSAESSDGACPQEDTPHAPALLRLRSPVRDWYFIAEQPAPAPHLARPEGRAALTHMG